MSTPRYTLNLIAEFGVGLWLYDKIALGKSFCDEAQAIIGASPTEISRQATGLPEIAGFTGNVMIIRGN